MRKLNFIDDVHDLRAQAKEHMNRGVITMHYDANADNIVDLLNVFLATELLCTLRYRNHHYQAKQLGASVASAEFLEHSQQEQEHADKLAERIAQLGGIPNYNPEYMLEASHAEYVECTTIDDMVKENMIAERVAIDTYRQAIQHLKDKDPTTRRLLEDILATEEEHADDMLELKDEYDIVF